MRHLKSNRLHFTPNKVYCHIKETFFFFKKKRKKKKRKRKRKKKDRNETKQNNVDSGDIQVIFIEYGLIYHNTICGFGLMDGGV
jgi:hypothetical protein